MVALDYRGKAGIATAIGHAPQVGLANAAAGSVMAVAESLTNIVWAPLAQGLQQRESFRQLDVALSLTRR